MRLAYAPAAMAASCFYLTSCVSFSSLQTARTLTPEKASWTLAAGYESLVIEKARGLDSESEKSVENFKVPMIEFGIRYGVMDHLDVGARTALLGTSSVDAKYGFYRGPSYAAAAGVGAGYGSLKSDNFSMRFYEVFFPQYNSYDFARTFSVYGVPRLVYRHTQTSYYEMDASYGTALLGASVGFVAGSKVAFAPEVSYFKDVGLSGDSGILQVMVALIFGFDNTEQPTPEISPIHRPRRR